jgi:hypothetical protein
MVQRMTGGDPNLIGLGDPSLVLRHQLQNLAPKEQHHRATKWFLRTQEDVPSIVAQIADFAEAWVLPFMHEYVDTASLAGGYDGGDERLRLGHRFYLYVTAANIILGKVERGRAILEEWFGRPGPRRQYAKVFAYVDGLGSR